MRNEGPKCKNGKRLQNLGCQTWHYLKAKISHFWSKEETKNVIKKRRQEKRKRREEEEPKRYGFCMECIELCIDTCLGLRKLT